MKNTSHEDLVKQLFSYIARLGPSFKAHVEAHVGDLAPEWLDTMRHYEISVCEDAIKQFKRQNVTRFPNLGYFIEILNQSRRVVKADDGKRFGEYQAVAQQLRNYKAMSSEQIKGILSALHGMEVYHPEWARKLEGELRDIVWFAGLFLRLDPQQFNQVESSYAKGLGAINTSPGNDNLTNNTLHAQNDAPPNSPREVSTYFQDSR